MGQFKCIFWVTCPSHNSYHFDIGPCLGGSVWTVSDSWPGGWEFDHQLRQTFFPANFRLSPLQKHVRKVVSYCLRKKSCVSNGVRKPGNTCASSTAMIYDLNCKSGNKPQCNQPLWYWIYIQNFTLMLWMLAETVQNVSFLRQQRRQTCSDNTQTLFSKTVKLITS